MWYSVARRSSLGAFIAIAAVGAALTNLAAADAVLIASNQGWERLWPVPSQGDWTYPKNPVASGFQLDWRAMYTLSKTYWDHPTGPFDGIAVNYQWPYQDDPTFTWHEVQPVYDDYSMPGAELSYVLADDPTSGWDKSGIPTSEPGTRWYFVQAEYNDVTSYSYTTTQQNQTYQEATGDRRVKNSVTRVTVTGDYPELILQWASAQCEIPFVYGSDWSNQVQQWVGADCADMVGHAIKLSGHTSFPYPDAEPYAQGLYGHAVYGRHGLSIRTNWTLYDPANPTIPQPEPGDIVLIDYNWSSGQHVADHATLFESGDGEDAGYLDQGDLCCCACAEHNKVHRTDYADAYLSDQEAGVRYVAVLAFEEP